MLCYNIILEILFLLAHTICILLFRETSMENTKGPAVVPPSAIPGEAGHFFPRHTNTVANHYADMSAPLIRGRASEYDEPTVFADIYKDETNIAIWRRDLPIKLQRFIAELLQSNRPLQASMTVTPQNVHAGINELLGDIEQNNALSADIVELVDMFCYLFDLKQVGLRLKTLDQAMCPRFHVDSVPCRLVTTYQGPATQWLPHQAVDRTKLGHGNKGLPDQHSGIYQNQKDIHQLNTGDVALIKGECWEGNENAGLVHRSPALNEGERRLLLTLDIIS